MRVFAIVVAILFAGFAVPAAAMAQDDRPEQPPAIPDPNFAGTFNGERVRRSAAAEEEVRLRRRRPVEKESYEPEGWGATTGYERYPGSCVRMRFAYGPLLVKPGQNDVLIGPVTIEKPRPGRLHHPLQAEPDARSTAACPPVAARCTCTTAPGSR